MSPCRQPARPHSTRRSSCTPSAHLTGEPAELAIRATAYLADASELLLADLIVAETVFVLESFYETPRSQVAGAVRSLLAFEPIVTIDPALLLRAVEVYETDRLDFADAYLVPAPRAPA